MGRLARRWRAAFVAVLLTAVPFASPAQFGPSAQDLGPVYLDVDTTAAIHLQRADASLADGQWAEGLDVLTQVMQTYADKLVELSDGRYVNVQTLCQSKIAALPAEALREYRRRVDGQAAAWYEQAAGERREELLERIVRQAFCSSWGDDALWLLGEMALEQGEYWQARSYWERILPPSSPYWKRTGEADQAGGSSIRVLCYPDSDLDLGAVRARLVLCLVLGGDRAGAQRELAALRRDYPDATGLLAGTEGTYAQTLAGLLEESLRWSPVHSAPDWSTFAGNPQRNQTLPFTVELGAKVGSVELRGVERRAAQRRVPSWRQPRIAEDLREPLSYFPALVDGQLLVNNAGGLVAVDPSTCKPLWQSFGQPDRAWSSADSAERYTLTVYEGRAYATTSSPRTGFSSNRAAVRRFGRRGFMPGLGLPNRQSAIICWDLAKEGEALWEIQPPEPNLVFEGSPVVEQGRFYVAMRRDGPSTQALVACYDDAQRQRIPGAPDRIRLPQLRWMRFVCQASTLSSLSGRPSHCLLTLAGDHVYSCTNLGAIAALSARDGTVEWVFTYPRRTGDAPDHFARDLNPCLVHQGSVVAAPADAPEIFALDAATGRQQWATELLPDAVHLLGVGAGNLIASGRGLYFVNMSTGKVLRQFLHVDEPPSRGYGRGILSGGRVYWPTREEIWVFDQATGLPVQRLWLKPHGETGGNLLLADGYLVIAQPARLVVFAQYSRLFEKYQQAVAAKPEDAQLRYGLGRAAEATRQWDLAETNYRAAARLAQSDDAVEAEPLALRANERLYALLSQRGDAAAEAGEWAEAVRRDQQAAELAVSAPLRVEALLRCGERWLQAGRAEEAIRIYQRVLADEALATAPVTVAEPLMVPARRTVQRKIAEIVQQHGQQVYAEFDQEAQDALDAAVSQGDDHAAEALLDRYPSAVKLRDVLADRALEFERQDRLRDASRLYRKLLAVAENAAQRKMLVDRLAGVYEADGLRAASLVAERAAGASQNPVQPAAYQLESNVESASLAAVVPLGLPLVRSWQRTLPENARLVQPEGPPPTVEPRWLHVADAGGLACWSLIDGHVEWRIPTGGAVLWLGYAGDTLLVGTSTDVASVNLSDGRWNWRRRLQDNDGWTISASVGMSSAAAQPQFLLDGGRLYYHKADRIVALHPWTGETLWSMEGTGDDRLVGLTPDGTLLVLRPSENELVQIETAEGRIASRALVSQGSVAPAPRCLSSGRVCFVPDRRTVELYDLGAGGRLWRFQQVSAQGQPEVSAQGWPDVFGDGRRLLLALLGRQELVRLDPESGSELWRYHLGKEGLGSSRFEPHTLAFADEQAFYYAAEGVLRAVALQDGRMLWQQHIGRTNSPWRVCPARECVVAYPVDAAPASANAESGSSVVLCDRRSGLPVERWNFEAAPSVEGLVLGSHHVAVAEKQKLCGFRLWEYSTSHERAQP